MHFSIKLVQNVLLMHVFTLFLSCFKTLNWQCKKNVNIPLFTFSSYKIVIGIGKTESDAGFHNNMVSKFNNHFKNGLRFLNHLTKEIINE